MDYDGYQLYELLKDGAETTLTHQGSTYTLRFIGKRTGSDNYLAVTNQDGDEKRFGWGWSSEQVWRALAHLEAGWNTKQTPPYRHYDESEEEEGGLAY
jgi:hypothetical protein